jgi:aspartyl-tRNA(Asn)/glutamyl-tRNA(Gln) amidotransferase subunit A
LPSAYLIDAARSGLVPQPPDREALEGALAACFAAVAPPARRAEAGWIVVGGPGLDAGLAQGVRGKRIGVIRHFHESDNPVSPATLAGIENTIAVLRAEGAIISDITLPSLAEYNATGWAIIYAESFAVHEAWMQAAPEKYGEYMRPRLALGALMSAADYIQAQRRRADLITRSIAATQGVDLRITASAMGEAPPITAVSKWASLEKPGFTMPFNVLGWPALSLCSGFGEAGLPVSVQIIGKPFDDASVLAAGHTFEKATAFRATRPAI